LLPVNEDVEELVGSRVVWVMVFSF
jgi:hypothetical protein